MTDDKKMQDNSIEDTLSSIKNIVEGEVATSSDSVIDLTETDMVSTSDNTAEELIDIKSFDETGDLKVADEDAALKAKAQNGDDFAIEQFSKSLTGEDAPAGPVFSAPAAEEPAAEQVEEEVSGQDDIDALLNNLGKVADDASTQEDLSGKAASLESASKTYAGKDFSGSTEYEGEDDIDSEEEDDTPPVEASIDDIAAAMAAQTANEKKAEEMAKQELVKNVESKVTQRVALKAVPAASGLQVGFPVEVLAEALRPMIADWVEENLPSIVEKLVKEELSKLADK
jgi:cell pole-organizing protein PopZ